MQQESSHKLKPSRNKRNIANQEESKTSHTQTGMTEKESAFRDSEEEEEEDDEEEEDILIKNKDLIVSRIIH